LQEQPIAVFSLFKELENEHRHFSIFTLTSTVGEHGRETVLLAPPARLTRDGLSRLVSYRP